MKSFFKTFLAALLALVVGSLLLLFITIGFFSAIASLSDQPVEVKSNSVLMLKLNKQIVDRKENNPLEDLDMPGFVSKSTLGLNQILRSIEKAKTDDRIKGIYINTTDINAGYATVEEIRNALIDFKTSGKFIYAYADVISQKAYYLSTTADSVVLNPQGLFDFRGISSNRMFYKRAMDKLGVEMQIVRGKNNKFKSAVEPFMYDKMSDASRAQLSLVLNSIWGHILNGISETRNISVDDLNQYADKVMTLRGADKAKEAGFFDNLKYKDQVIDDLRELTGTAREKDVPTISISKYSKVPKKSDGKGLAKKKLAVIYAQGEIDSGQSDAYAINSEEISKAVREARTDSTIKAVVLRVNSPGGSAFGSEVIWREVALTQATKPVIISMGDLAASGGYYISCPADTILASPTTITGSIGIFGMIPNAGELLNDKIGITFDQVKTNKHSDMPVIYRKMTTFEKNLMQEHVEKGYQTFLSRVADGRKTTPEAIDKIGQGRIWSGANGIENGLVDGIGGLNDAIAIAAQKAGLERYRTVELPKQKDPFEELIKNLTSEAKIQVMKVQLGEAYQYWKNISRVKSMNGIYTRMPYDLTVE